MSTIEYINAREVLDSRGNPTVEVELATTSGAYGRAIVPSGASTGENEALELRDGDPRRYAGKGVLKAIDNVTNVIAPQVLGMDVLEQVELDHAMRDLDGTDNKSKLGANAILGVSMAAARAAADLLGIPLYRYLGGCNAKVMPVPMFNVLNGGAHADNDIDIQEFMIVPVGAKSFIEAVRWGAEIFHILKKILKKDNLSTSVGDEGGFAPNLKDSEQVFQYIINAVNEAGYSYGQQVRLAIDAAANHFYNKDQKIYKFFTGGARRDLTSQQLIDIYAGWVDRFSLISIEDGLYEDDWEGWQLLTEKLGKKIQLVGDDLFVTNPHLLSKGIEGGCANSILIKLNQIGTVTETLDTIQMAKEAGYTTVVSHRSGETEDTFLVDLAVGTNAGQVKTGSLSRTDRTCKYNEFMRIEEDLEGLCNYPGLRVFKFEVK